MCTCHKSITICRKEWIKFHFASPTSLKWHNPVQLLTGTNEQQSTASIPFNTIVSTEMYVHIWRIVQWNECLDMFHVSACILHDRTVDFAAHQKRCQVKGVFITLQLLQISFSLEKKTLENRWNYQIFRFDC